MNYMELDAIYLIILIDAHHRRLLSSELDPPKESSSRSASSVWHSSLIQVLSSLVTYAHLSSCSLTAVFSYGRSRSVPLGKQHALFFLFSSVSFL